MGNQVKIGQVELKNNLILAPMAGYTTSAMRRLAAENGAGMTVTEMVSIKGLLYKNQKTFDLLRTSPAEKVTCAQLFGSDPQEFFRCAALPALAAFDIIDINMGCPVKKVVANGEGSALMRSPFLAASIVKALKDGGKTVTVKTRLSDTTAQTVDFVGGLLDAGASMVALHARTPEQMYRGTADYAEFEKIRRQITGLLGFSGDITDQKTLKLAHQTGADFFMIGRGALINPAIFSHLTNDNIGEQELNTQRRQLVLQLFEYMCKDVGNEWAVKDFRKFLPFVLKNEKVQKDKRHSLNFITSATDLRAELEAILAD